MQYRKFTEAEIAAAGGLGDLDRFHGIGALREMVSLAVETTPAFRRCLESGRGLRDWLQASRNACRVLREANSETTLGFLLRKGIQSEGMDWYTLADKVYMDYVKMAGSTTVAEYYAPLYNTSLPGPVERGDRFPVAAITGEDSNIRNIVFGQVLPIDRTLFDDDQTGQVRNYAQKLGEGMAQAESVWASSRFIGAARTYGSLTVPISGYTTRDVNGTTVTGPFSTSIFDGSASGNRPSSYGQLTMPRLARGYVQTMQATDPLRNRIVVRVNRLIVSNMDALNGQVLLAPGPWPAVIGQGNLSGSNQPTLGGTSNLDGANLGVSAGYPGGWGSPNPFAGMGWKLVQERFFPDWAWALCEQGKGLIFQVRDELEIQEEGRNGGSYFDFDVIRYKSRKRFNVDWVGGGSRFAYLGNDGTVSGSL